MIILFSQLNFPELAIARPLLTNIERFVSRAIYGMYVIHKA